MATGFPPFCQTKQFFSPAEAPVILSGWKGPGMFLPTAGPDLRESPATAPATASTATANAPTTIRCFIAKRPPRKIERYLQGDHNEQYYRVLRAFADTQFQGDKQDLWRRLLHFVNAALAIEDMAGFAVTFVFALRRLFAATDVGTGFVAANDFFLGNFHRSFWIFSHFRISRIRVRINTGQ
jgi:hypothetical protein